MESLSKLLWCSALLRAGLLLFGEFQDRYLQVKYTDIDYQVFTDAAQFVSLGGSPYERSTYRYSPLLAYLLLPNIWLTSCFGKVLFSTLDVLAGWLITQIVKLQGASPRAATAAAALWLFNPWTFTISTRGSCDVLVVLLLLWMLLQLQTGAVTGAAVTYGLAVHLRIYPIIYAPALVLFLAARAAYVQHIKGGGRLPEKVRPSLVHIILQGLYFGLISGSLFVGLHLLFSRLYGALYTQEAFLHHLTRKDHRHNFSIYYYSIYLSYEDRDGSTSSHGMVELPSVHDVLQTFSAIARKPVAELLGIGLDLMPQISWSSVGSLVRQPAALAFVPQILVLVAMSLKLHKDLPLCCLLQSICFVAFNKVCTAQYFVWWMCLLPLVLPRLPWPLPPPLIRAAVFWAAAQLHWLAWAYLLEFQGLPVHLGIWVASLLFLTSNVLLVIQLLHHVESSSSFIRVSASCADVGREGVKAAGVAAVDASTDRQKGSRKEGVGEAVTAPLDINSERAKGKGPHKP